MQGMVVVALAQKAPVASGGGVVPGGEGDVSASSGFAALLAAQMLGGADVAKVPVAGTPLEELLGGDGKPKDTLTDATLDPATDVVTDAALGAGVLVPPVVVPSSGVLRDLPSTSDGQTQPAGQGASALQLVALQKTAQVDPANLDDLGTARSLHGDGFKALGLGLSGNTQEARGKAQSEIPVGEAGGPVAGNVKGELAKMAEIAAGGKTLPESADDKNVDPRLTSPVQVNTPRLTDTSSAAMLQASMGPAPALQAGDANGANVALQPAVGSPGWGDALGQKVVWMAGQQQQVAELHLNPPNLGPMEVRLTVSNDQVTAVFVSHQPAVREAIEAAMPRLREMFADGGMTLGNATVSSDSLPRHQFSGQEGRPSSGAAQADYALGSDASTQGVVRGVLPLRSDGRGAVDLFA